MSHAIDTENFDYTYNLSKFTVRTLNEMYIIQNPLFSILTIIPYSSPRYGCYFISLGTIQGEVKLHLYMIIFYYPSM